MSWIAYILAIGAGAANPFQSGTNAELNKSLDSPVWTALYVYLSAFLAVLLIQSIVREAWPFSGKLNGLPWWAWAGGMVSISSTMAGLVFAQKLGSGVFTGLTVTAALISSIVLDHYGLIGFKVHPASAMRLLGGALMITGLWVIAKF
jgi:transporter family-2 protein